MSNSHEEQYFNRYKEGKTISLSTSEKHTVTPHNDPEQSQYTCHGVRSERPLYSKESQLFKTKNLRKCDRRHKVSLVCQVCEVQVSHVCSSLSSPEEEGAALHLRLSLLWHCCCFPWMYFPQGDTQTRFDSWVQNADLWYPHDPTKVSTSCLV